MTKIDRIFPSEITFDVDVVDTCQVVRLSIKGELSAGLAIGSIVLKPSMVTISGPNHSLVSRRDPPLNRMTPILRLPSDSPPNEERDAIFREFPFEISFQTRTGAKPCANGILSQFVSAGAFSAAL